MTAFCLAISDFNTLYSSSKNMTVKFAVRDSITSYSTTVIGAYTLIKQAFSASGGIRAMVGGDSDDPAKGVGEVVQDFELPMVSYGSPTTDLSHGSQFPNSVRVYPSDSFQAAALVDVIHSFGWTRVFVVQSMDTFGSDAFAEFEHAAKPYGIDIVYKVVVEQNKLAAHDSKAAAAESEAIKGWWVALHSSKLPLVWVHPDSMYHYLTAPHSLSIRSYESVRRAHRRAAPRRHVVRREFPEARLRHGHHHGAHHPAWHEPHLPPRPVGLLPGRRAAPRVHRGADPRRVHRGRLCGPRLDGGVRLWRQLRVEVSRPAAHRAERGGCGALLDRAGRRRAAAVPVRERDWADGVCGDGPLDPGGGLAGPPGGVRLRRRHPRPARLAGGDRRGDEGACAGSVGGGPE
jgi:hypothetical protein